MPFADSCTALGSPLGSLSPFPPCGLLGQRLQVSRGNFVRFPCIPAESTPRQLDGLGTSQPVARSSRQRFASYPVFVHRYAGLLHASSRPASRRYPCASLI